MLEFSRTREKLIQPGFHKHLRPEKTIDWEDQDVQVNTSRSLGCKVAQVIVNVMPHQPTILGFVIWQILSGRAIILPQAASFVPVIRVVHDVLFILTIGKLTQAPWNATLRTRLLSFRLGKETTFRTARDSASCRLQSIENCGNRLGTCARNLGAGTGIETVPAFCKAL